MCCVVGSVGRNVCLSFTEACAARRRRHAQDLKCEAYTPATQTHHAVRRTYMKQVYAPMHHAGKLAYSGLLFTKAAPQPYRHACTDADSRSEYHACTTREYCLVHVASFKLSLYYAGQPCATPLERRSAHEAYTRIDMQIQTITHPLRNTCLRDVHHDTCRAIADSCNKSMTHCVRMQAHGSQEGLWHLAGMHITF